MCGGDSGFGEPICPFGKTRVVPGSPKRSHCAGELAVAFCTGALAIAQNTPLTPAMCIKIYCVYNDFTEVIRQNKNDDTAANACHMLGGQTRLASRQSQEPQKTRVNAKNIT